jgi:FkbM family methyltransferase
MKHLLKAIVTSCFRATGLGISSKSDIDLLWALPKSDLPFLLSNMTRSKAQGRQDLFVLQQLNRKSNGYFVEFGATNGIDISNTYLLETGFGWTGILAEPARCWHTSLAQNRKASLELNCIWKDTGSILTFNEVENADLSTISDYSNSDFWRAARETGETYDVKTISLIDLLRKQNAPKHIDYLSIDTEGSEFEILNAFDFAEYPFGVITCEHNYSPMRERIYSLLSSHGYVRRFERVSKYDDWYVKTLSRPACS